MGKEGEFEGEVILWYLSALAGSVNNAREESSQAFSPSKYYEY